MFFSVGSVSFFFFSFFSLRCFCCIYVQINGGGGGEGAGRGFSKDQTITISFQSLVDAFRMLNVLSNIQHLFPREETASEILHFQKFLDPSLAVQPYDDMFCQVVDENLVLRDPQIFHQLLPKDANVPLTFPYPRLQVVAPFCFFIDGQVF